MKIFIHHKWWKEQNKQTVIKKNCMKKSTSVNSKSVLA